MGQISTNGALVSINDDSAVPVPYLRARTLLAADIRLSVDRIVPSIDDFVPWA